MPRIRQYAERDAEKDFLREIRAGQGSADLMNNRSLSDACGMLACVLLFTAIDMMMHVDVLGWLPVDARNALDACGVVKMGVTELFALLFILYEATSVLKNMLLCGLPVPAGLRDKLAKWLDSMTDETRIDVVMEMTKPAVLDDAATADAARQVVDDDDREESGLLDM